MKASDYYEKYDKLISDAKAKGVNTIGIFKDMFLEFSGEAVTIYKKRHASSIGALKSIILEQNEKWNALSRIFEKNYGTSPLKRHGFRDYWADKMPELALLVKGKGVREGWLNG